MFIYYTEQKMDAGVEDSTDSGHVICYKDKDDNILAGPHTSTCGN